MSKKIISTLLAVLLLFVAFAACAPSENTESAVGSSSAESSAAQGNSNTSVGASSKIVKYGEASYGITPLGELIEECPVIVRGKVARKIKAVDVIWPMYGEGDESDTVVHTYYEIEVSELFKGGPEHAEKTVFGAFGGETDTTIHIVNGGADMPKIGEERFFFIYESGGASIRFPMYSSNTVILQTFDAPEMFKDAPKDVKGKSIPADEFAEILRDKIAEANAQKKQ